MNVENNNKYNAIAFCINCSERSISADGYNPRSKMCPIFQREQKILSIMSDNRHLKRKPKLLTILSILDSI